MESNTSAIEISFLYIYAIVVTRNFRQIHVSDMKARVAGYHLERMESGKDGKRIRLISFAGRRAINLRKLAPSGSVGWVSWAFGEGARNTKSHSQKIINIYYPRMKYYQIA